MKGAGGDTRKGGREKKEREQERVRMNLPLRMNLLAKHSKHMKKNLIPRKTGKKIYYWNMNSLQMPLRNNLTKILK